MNFIKIFLFFVKILFFSLIYSPYILFKKFDVFLSKILSIMGPAFIKFAQILSTRADIISKFWAENLSKTQDDMPHESKKHIRLIFMKNFNQYPENIFKEFHYKPISAASIAQVHYAVLKNGSKSAIKILRKDILIKIKKNIFFLKAVISLINKRFKDIERFRLIDLVNLLENNLIQETNMLLEAESAIKLKNNLKNNDGIYIPKIYKEYTRKDILSMEWIEHRSLSKIKNFDEFDKKIILKNLINSFCDQAYKYSFFHADLHPGNIFINESGPNKNQIILIDFGSIGYLDNKTKFYITEILRGFVYEDYELVARIHFMAGYVDKSYSIIEFENACRELGKKFINRKLNEISVGDIFTSLLKLTSDFQMKTRPELILIQKATILVEAAAAKIDPNSNIWALNNDWLKKNYMSPQKIFFRKIIYIIHIFRKK